MSVPPNEVPVPPSEPSPTPSAEERQWAMFAHLSALAGAILTGHMFGWGCFIGPLVIWLIKKDTMPFVNDQAREALNFNITLAIIGLVLLVLTIGTFFLGALLTIPVAVFALAPRAAGWRDVDASSRACRIRACRFSCRARRRSARGRTASARVRRAAPRWRARAA